MAPRIPIEMSYRSSYRKIMPSDKSPHNAVRIASIATEFGVTFAIFVLAGSWLDGKFSDKLPTFTLLGAAAGFVLGMVRLVHQAKQYQKKDAGKDDGHGRNDGQG